MGYTREERLDIGKQIYNNEISKNDAAEKYGISTGTARDYMRLYRDVNNLPHKNKTKADGIVTQITTHSSKPDLSGYESMTREELIHELIKSKVNIARLKKGYEVKGAGVRKTFTIFANKNTK